MHGRNGLECIFDRHLDVIAAAHANDRSEYKRRVSVCPCRLAANKSMSARCNLERDCVFLFCCIHKPRDWQRNVEVRRASFRDPPTNDAG